MDLKRAIGIGIGLFLAIIGLVNGGIVVNSEATLITLNPDLSNLPVLVFVVGLALTSMLVARKIRGGLLVGILATTVFAIIVNQGFGDSSGLRSGHRGHPRQDRRRRRTSGSWATSTSGCSTCWGSPPPRRRSSR